MREDIRADWRNKRVAVIGLGISNQALIGFLKKAGAAVSGRDQKTAEELGVRFQELEELGIELICGPGYLRDLAGYDTIFVSPGVPRHLPELREAATKTDLSSEISLVFRYSRAPIYGITGSSGKTTVTSLAREMLGAGKTPVYAGGNIGRPLISEISKVSSNDLLLLELSSFQLQDLAQSPHGAVITNIAPNHLDVHGTMEDYCRAKQNIYRHQKPADFLVLNYDNPAARSMAKDAPGAVLFFSLKTRVVPGAYLDGQDLVYEDDKERIVFARQNRIKLLGGHNTANVLAAAILSRSAGAGWEAVSEVSESFSGVPHRLELVREIAGVRYYNDSIATTPDRTDAALRSFTAPIILIAGGSDKDLPFDELGKAIHRRVKNLILVGSTAVQIREAVRKYGDFPIEEVENLAQAVASAADRAQAGDVVLLSPASASYDQYSDFMERGNHFRRLVDCLAK